MLLALLLACTVPPSPQAVQGQLDLRDWQPDAGPVRLDGEWDFYPGVLLPPDGHATTSLTPTSLPVPATWEDRQGVGTYHLDVLLPPEMDALQVTMLGVAGAAQAWVDEQPLPAIGTVHEEVNRTEENNGRSTVMFTPQDDGRTSLTIQVSNSRFRMGGIHKSVVLSTPAFSTIDTAWRLSWAGFSIALTFVMGLGFFILSTMRQFDRGHMYFGAFCMVQALREMVGGSAALLSVLWPSIPWSLRLHVEYMTLPLGCCFGVGMMASFAGYSLQNRSIQWIQLFSLMLAVITLGAPLTMDGLLLPLNQIWMVLIMAISMGLLLRGAWRNHGAARTLSLWTPLPIAAFTHDALVSSQIIASPVLLAAPAFLLLILAQGVLMTRDFARSMNRVEELNHDLQIAHRDLEKTHRSALRFVPMPFLERLGHHSITDIQHGDHAQLDMSILFCDLRSFTPLIEGLGPQRAFSFINRYLRIMEPAITDHDGFINQYLGDAIMALFGGPSDQAVLAACDMVDALQRFNANEPEGPVSFGIGIGSGSLMLGVIGGIERLDGGVIGDAVNQSARIEGMTKIYGATVLLDESTVTRLQNPDRFALRRLDRVFSKGRQTPSAIYEVLDALPPTLRSQRLANLTLWQAAQDAWCAGAFAEAKSHFERCLETDPEDKPAQLFVSRCEHFLANGAPQDWDGILRLQRKS